MFDVLFGWRKASKCTKLIRRVQGRIRLLRNKRDSIVKKLRDDVAWLVKMRYLEIATKRLLKDECMMEMYDLRNRFCELVVSNMSYIRRHRECPNDISEAVSSLIFASARCGDLPELRRIRELFRERYGERFALVTVNLLPGNLVNPKIRDQPLIKAISKDSKSRIVGEFVRDQLGTQPEILAIEHVSELHMKKEEMAEHQAVCLEIIPVSPVIVVDSKQEDTGAIAVEKNVTAFDNSVMAAENGLKAGKSKSQTQLLAKSASLNVDQFARMPPPYERNATVWCSKEKECGSLPDKVLRPVEGTLTSSSGESSPQFTDLKVVCLDDVEEVQSNRKLDVEGLDQRLFEFKQSAVTESAKPDHSNWATSKRKLGPAQ